MVPRFAVSLLPTGLVLLALLPASAWAHGPVLRGLQINAPITLSQETSNCACDQRWLTMGLSRGRVSVSVKVTQCRLETTPTCGVFVYLLRGVQQMASATTGCRIHGTRCGASTVLNYKVTSPGVYYVLVRGSGSTIIKYTLGIRAHMYPLHCHKYC